MAHYGLCAALSKADFELSHYLMAFSVEKCVTVRFCWRFYNAPDSLTYFIGNQQIPVKQMHKDRP